MKSYPYENEKRCIFWSDDIGYEGNDCSYGLFELPEFDVNNIHIAYKEHYDKALKLFKKWFCREPSALELENMAARIEQGDGIPCLNTMRESCGNCDGCSEESIASKNMYRDKQFKDWVYAGSPQVINFQRTGETFSSWSWRDWKTSNNIYRRDS